MDVNITVNGQQMEMRELKSIVVKNEVVSGLIKRAAGRGHKDAKPRKQSGNFN